jgi:hypothetical protein
MRYVVFALLVVGLWAHRAAACPCCDPCHKYDHLRDRIPPVEALATGYVAIGATLGEHPKQLDVMRVLTSARFIAEQSGVRALRIVDAAHVPSTVDHRDHARIEIVHDLALRHGHFQITLEGVRYTISPCLDDQRRASTCLAAAAE